MSASEIDCVDVPMSREEFMASLRRTTAAGTRIVTTLRFSSGACSVCHEPIDLSPIDEETACDAGVSNPSCGNCGAYYDVAVCARASLTGKGARPARQAFLRVVGADSGQQSLNMQASRVADATTSDNVRHELDVLNRQYTEEYGRALPSNILDATAAEYNERVRARGITKRGEERKQILAALVKRVANRVGRDLTVQEIVQFMQLRGRGVTAGENFLVEIDNGSYTKKVPRAMREAASAADAKEETDRKADRKVDATVEATAVASPAVAAPPKLFRANMSAAKEDPECRAVVTTLYDLHGLFGVEINGVRTHMRDSDVYRGLVDKACRLHAEADKQAVGIKSQTRSRAAAAAFVILARHFASVSEPDPIIGNPAESLEKFCSVKSGSAFYIRQTSIKTLTADLAALADRMTNLG